MIATIARTTNITANMPKMDKIMVILNHLCLM